MQSLNKKVGIVGSRGIVRRASFLNTNELLSKVGNNSGNLLFQYAVHELIEDERLIVGLDLPWKPDIVRKNCRILVVPSANFVRENFDITAYIDFLESCNLPILFLGLGAQAADYSVKKINVHPSIKRLLSIIKDQDIGVGVRGTFSADILNDYGITNLQIIGCPSNFLNPDEQLGEKLHAKWMRDTETIMTTGDEPWPQNSIKQLAERKLVKMALEMSGIYVQQSVEPFIKILRRANPYDYSDINENLVDSLRLAIAPDLDRLGFRRFLSSTVRFYISVEQWLEEASKFDLGIGLRLHGNMVSFQAGCPSIWIYHDSRTQELVETMALPSLSLNDFLIYENITDIKMAVNPDFEKYTKRRKELKQDFKNLLEKNNISLAC